MYFIYNLKLEHHHDRQKMIVFPIARIQGRKDVKFILLHNAIAPKIDLKNTINRQTCIKQQYKPIISKMMDVLLLTL